MGLMGIGLNSPHNFPCSKTHKLIARLSLIPRYIAIMDMIDTRWQCEKHPCVVGGGSLNAARIDLDGSNGDWIEFTTYLCML